MPFHWPMFAFVTALFSYMHHSKFVLFIFNFNFFFFFVLLTFWFHCTQTSNNFFHKDGRGSVIDEQINEAINFEEVGPYNLGTLITLPQYRGFQSNLPTEAIEQIDLKMKELADDLSEEVTNRRKYNVCSDKQRSVFSYWMKWTSPLRWTISTSL